MPNKALGQHWLRDRTILKEIAAQGKLGPDDTVLEIGPGPGGLTSVLLAQAGRVVSVEFDPEVARKLPGQFPGKNLEVVQGDILEYDLGKLPSGYKVVANIPYYITKKIIQNFVRAANQPEVMVLLVQQEVAQKYAAVAGDLTLQAVELQLTYDVHVSTRVPKTYFTPVPAVDSQVLVCTKIHVDKNAYIDNKSILRVARAGFASPRKKLRTTLSSGLGISRELVEATLRQIGASPDVRAQDLSVADWAKLADILAA